MIEKVISRFPSSADKLRTKANIIKNEAFESTIVKIQSDNKKHLSLIEARTMKALLLTGSVQVVGPCKSRTPTCFNRKVLKQMRSSEVKMESKFMDSQFILGTSIIYERHSSKTGFAFWGRS